MLNIRKALPEEAGLLSDLGMRSKAYWGYSQDFLDACRSELTVDPAQMNSDGIDIVVAVDGDSLVGFYSLRRLSVSVYELDSLFVEPERIGSGIGRALVGHATHRLSERGAARLIIQGDPNASRFYAVVGGRQIGTRASGSIPGRYLPLFEIEIRGE